MLVHCRAMQDTLTIRIERSLKVAADKAAAARDETLSQVVRRALRQYVSENAQGELLPRSRRRDVVRNDSPRP